MVIDTHCHLDVLSGQVLNDQLNPADLYLTMGTHAEDWPTLIQLCRKYPNIYAAIGLHPWYVSGEYGNELEILQEFLTKYKVTAIGEIGLDFAPDYVDLRNHQLDAFECQLRFALEYSLPVSLHVYKAHNEMIALLKQYPVKGVVHSLGSSVQIAREYLDLGLKFGVNAVVVRENARRYHELVKTYGLESIVLETDSPNITLPGKMVSDLADIYVVVEAVSRITGTTPEEVVKLTNANANQIFHFLEE